MESGFATIEARFDEIFANFPNRPAAWLLRFMLLPLGPRRRGPSDRLTRRLRQYPAGAVGHPRPPHRRHLPRHRRRRARAPRARLRGTVATQPLRDRMRKARVRDIDKARAQGLINEAEAAQLTPPPRRLRPPSRSMISRPRNCRRGLSSRETCYRKRCRDQRPRNDAAVRSTSSTAAARRSSARAGGRARSRRSISRSPAGGRCCCASRSRPMPSTRSSSAASTCSPTR